MTSDGERRGTDRPIHPGTCVGVGTPDDVARTYVCGPECPPVDVYKMPSVSRETPRSPTPAEQLANWWRQAAEREIEQTVDKAVEYGSTDLIDIGRNIARLSGREVDDQEAAELGVFFYLEGKLARWRSAIVEDRRVSDDTLLDIGVYDRMAQRIRYAGSWPGIDYQKILDDSHAIMHSMCCQPCGPNCAAPAAYRDVP